MNASMNTIERALVRATHATIRRARRAATAGAPRPADRPPRVLIIGYSGKRNTGAEVRSAEIVRQLAALPELSEATFSVLTLSPEATRPYFPEGTRMIKTSSFFFPDLLRACTEHDIGVLTEGSCLKSATSNVAALFFICAAGILREQGKPCIGFGVEAGPMEPAVEAAARRYCTSALFIARSQGSLDRCRELGLEAILGTDTAWTTEPADDAWARAELARLRPGGLSGPLVGVSIINAFVRPVRPSLGKLVKTSINRDHRDRYSALLYYTRTPEREEQYRRYIRACKAAFERIERLEPGMVPVFIEIEPMDEGCVADLRAIYGRDGVRLSANDYDGAQMTALLRQLDLLITSRYHAHVLSMPGGVPCVAMSKDERLTGIFAEHQMSKYCVSTHARDLPARLPELCEDAWRDREALSRTLRARVPEYLARQAAMSAPAAAYLRRYGIRREGAKTLFSSLPGSFAGSYDEARARFLSALPGSGAGAHAPECILDSAPVGEPAAGLFTDYAYFPPARAKGRLITLVAGTHGIEGYVGSMVLCALLTELRELLIHRPPDTGVALVHAVNPFGFRYGRRVNENNVDLNRNFIESRPDEPALAPSFRSLPGVLAGVRRHGWRATERALTHGQAHDPRALFYGGRAPEPGARAFMTRYEDMISGYRAATLVDIHTGYGERFGQAFGARLSGRPLAYWRGVYDLPLFDLDAEADRPSDDAGAFRGFTVTGGLLAFAQAAHRRAGIGRDSLAMFWEFGTLGSSPAAKLEALRILLDENRGHERRLSRLQSKTITPGMARLFYPESEAWRRHAYAAAFRVLPRILGAAAPAGEAATEAPGETASEGAAPARAQNEKSILTR